MIINGSIPSDAEDAPAATQTRCLSSRQRPPPVKVSETQDSLRRHLHTAHCQVSENLSPAPTAAGEGRRHGALEASWLRPAGCSLALWLTELAEQLMADQSARRLITFLISRH